MLELIGSSRRVTNAAALPSRPCDAPCARLGLEELTPLLPRLDDNAALGGFTEAQAPFVFEQDRERMTFLASRTVRDRVFRRVVLRASYNGIGKTASNSKK